MVKDELSHKIYLITFKKPKYVMEIGEEIYGKPRRQTYPKLMGKDGAIQKCVDNGWIKKVDIEPPKEKPHGFEKRDYCIADSNIIINNIENKIKLSKTESKEISRILNSEIFKACIDDLSNFIDYPNQEIDAIEFISNLIGYICAYIYMVKNYTVYFHKKIVKLLPSKKVAPKYHKQSLEDLNKLEKEVQEKGFNKEKFLESNKIIYNKIFPQGRIITRKIKGELVDHYIDMVKEFFVLPTPLLNKISGIIPIHKFIFLNFMTGGFIAAEESNQIILKKLINIFKNNKNDLKKNF